MSDPLPSFYVPVILGVTMSGLAITLGVLVASGYLAFFRSARTHLDRVSFRLLVYALVSHVMFGILGPVEFLYVFSGWQCSLVAFLFNFNGLFSLCIFFCIGLNLMLVLVYNVNGRSMEKYYIIGSVVLSSACSVSAYASGRLGLDTKNHLCWYNSEDKNEMLRWVIGTETVWMLLLSAGEVVGFLGIVVFLLPFIFDSRGTVAKHSTDSESQTRGSTRLTIVRLRGIILRIGIYPLVSCLLNILGAVCSVYQLKEQDQPVPSGPPLLFGIMVYTARPLLYSIIAATDPSFIRALQAHRATSGSSSAEQTTQIPPSVCLSTFIDLSVQSTRGADWDHGMGSDTQVENSSFNPTESTVGAAFTTKKAESMGGEMEAVGVAKFAGPSSAAQWDVARQI